MRALTSLAVATVAGTALGLTTVPAHAETQTKNDVRDDVTVQGLSDGTAADRRRGDIRSLTGQHADGRLRFTFLMGDTSPGQGESAYFVDARFVTSAGEDYTTSLQGFGNESSTTLQRDGEPVTCDGVAGRVVTAKDRYILTVPRACVGNPTFVRFGGTVRYLGAQSTFYNDDARRDGVVGEMPKLGTQRLANN
jgi:hypothetical protein